MTKSDEELLIEFAKQLKNNTWFLGKDALKRGLSVFGYNLLGNLIFFVGFLVLMFLFAACSSIMGV